MNQGRGINQILCTRYLKMIMGQCRSLNILSDNFIFWATPAYFLVLLIIIEMFHVIICFHW